LGVLELTDSNYLGCHLSGDWSRKRMPILYLLLRPTCVYLASLIVSLESLLWGGQSGISEFDRYVPGASRSLDFNYRRCLEVFSKGSIAKCPEIEAWIEALYCLMKLAPDYNALLIHCSLYRANEKDIAALFFSGLA